MSRTIPAIAIAMTACAGRDLPLIEDAPLGSSTATVEPGTSSSFTSSTSTSDDGSSTGNVASSSDAMDPDPGGLFIVPDDCGPYRPACSMFEQDCPRGEKCTLDWRDDCFSNPVPRCFPVLDDPGQDGDRCTFVDIDGSRVDTCDVGLICWYAADGVGTCENFCRGSLDNPTCDEDETCLIGAAGWLALCVDLCDPLAQDCAVPGHVCYPINDQWLCAADASGTAGAYGDPCEYANACDPGHACILAANFTDCHGAIGCCSLVCDVLDEDADAMCAALDAGQSCEAWYARGNTPPGHEHVGVCILPP